MTTEDARRLLIEFIGTIRRPECSLEELSDDVNLFESGVVDSLAVVKIVMYLEETYDIDLIAEEIDPSELSSIGSILDVVERHREQHAS